MGGALIDKFVSINYKRHLALALVIRLVLIAYGIYHDSYSSVKYTDVDYKVFTDAAKHVLNNRSPYNRHTYRYSPLIAYAAIPNLLVHHSFGKILFSIIDILVGLLIRLIIKYNSKQYLPNKSTIDSCANIGMLSWLYNPITITIATRGNCDSIAAFNVLLTIYFLQCCQRPFLAGLMHGFAIHFRLYPIIYSLTMYMYLSKYSKLTVVDKPAINCHDNAHNDTCQNSKAIESNERRLVGCHVNQRKTIFKMKYVMYLVPNLDQIKLVTGCLLSLICLTSLFYYFYGYQFLYETYLFHFVRKDTRHNFSLYFYLLYLTAWIKNVGMWQNVLVVLPQFLLLVVFSIRYGLTKFACNFGILVQTIVFVIYNTVLTSQYFVWVMAILPLCLWQISIKPKSAFVLLIVWFVAQVAWLLPAYYLEFRGMNTFMLVWIQGVSFFCANIAILGRLIMYFRPMEKNKAE